MSRRERKKIFGQDPALRQALEPYLAEQIASLELVRDVLAEKLPESDFPFRFTGSPFRFTGSRSELVRFVRALFITGRIVPVGGAKMLRCVRHLLWLLHVPEGPNLSNVINKLTLTERQLRFFDDFRNDLEKQILSGK